jgi:enoyl-CoA hydratase/carnithine racemase
MPVLTRDGDVYLLNLGDGENHFTPEWMAAVSEAFDEVEHAEGPRALVTTASGKIWSNGLDLDLLLADPSGAGAYIASVQTLFSRLLTLPAPSIAALQGHTFAAGAMLALAHDTRLMRADRGFFCLPEIDLGIPFTPGMAALVQARLPHQTAHDAMITGRRYGGHEALAAGIVSSAPSEGELLPASMAAARELARTAGATLRTIRTEMYRRPLELLRQGIDPLDIGATGSD